MNCLSSMPSKTTINNNIQNEEISILLEAHGYIRDRIDVVNNSTHHKFITWRQKDYAAVEVTKISKKSNNYFDILKQLPVLQHLAQQQVTNENIIKYYEHFESENELYFFTEPVENAISLKDYVIRAHRLISHGKLNLKRYQKSMKNLLFSTAKAISDLHRSNIWNINVSQSTLLVENWRFVPKINDKVSVNPSIKLKLVNFSDSILLIDVNESDEKAYVVEDINITYSHPRCIDIWNLGKIAYFCFVGHDLNQGDSVEANEAIGGPYWAIRKGKLKQFIAMRGLLQYVTPDIMSLLNGLLNFNELKQWKMRRVFKHKLFMNMSN